MKYVIPDGAPARTVNKFDHSDCLSALNTKRKMLVEVIDYLYNALLIVFTTAGGGFVLTILNPNNLNIAAYLSSISSSIAIAILLLLMCKRWLNNLFDDCYLYEYWLHNAKSQDGQPHVWGLMSERRTKRIQHLYLQYYVGHRIGRNITYKSSCYVAEDVDRLILMFIKDKEL